MIEGRRITRLRERAGEAKKSLVREVGGLFDMSTPMAVEALLSLSLSIMGGAASTLILFLFFFFFLSRGLFVSYGGRCV